jgi:dienelactone hydrolase
MKVAARRFTPQKITRRTRLAAVAVICGLILVTSALGVLYFVSFWPFSEHGIVRRPLDDVPGDLVTYQAEDGVRLAAGWWRPDKNNPPVVILLHEENGSRVQWTPLIPTLVDRGFAVLAPDLRGFGQSNTIIRDGKEEPYTLVNRQDAILDVHAALNWLGTQSNLDLNHIGIVGARLGADLAYVATGLFPAVKAVVAITPGAYNPEDPLLTLIRDYDSHDVFIMAGSRKQWEDATQIGIRVQNPGGRRYVDHPELEGVALMAIDEPIKDILNWFTMRFASPIPTSNVH